jgi:uncharacterized protein YaiI (UPF0178 family)
MPMWIARRVWKRVPWKLVWLGSIWLVEKGRERMEANLTKRERQELLRLVTKSKGLPNTLSKRDKTRLKNIAGKALRG